MTKYHINIILLFVLLCIPNFTVVGQINVIEIDKVWVIPAAEKYMDEEPLTITAFTSSRSAGGRHDFFSEGDYWWPDSAHPDGPYIQKDGMTNPDNFVSHRKVLMRLSIQVAALTAAYRITGDKKYALKAIEHLRAWFVNEETKMNPSLLYAQAITRKFTGRGTGIIDTIHLIEVAQAIGIIGKDNLIPTDELAIIKKWFSDYLLWMTTHTYGIDEMNAKNNHGTCWVMQVAAFAKLVGDEEKTDFCRKRFQEVLLPVQMAEDGSFPLELKRTKPYNYSLFNLDALSVICTILSNDKDNLWQFTLPDGRNMRKGIEFMFPYISDKTKWPYPKDVMYFDYYPVRQPSLLFGGLAYKENKYIELWKNLNAHPDNEEIIRNFPVRQPILWLN
jgi:hypothetical protein